MKTPVKIIFDDESEEMFDEAEMLEQYIDDSEIQDYAEWHLDMKSEDDFEEQSIDDFSDEEILYELLHRYKIKTDIVSIGKITEFLNNYYL
jgi:hypothetical protein